jgi:hypothetical protein
MLWNEDQRGYAQPSRNWVTYSKHMEFLRMRGEFAGFPYEMVVNGIRQAHPKLFETSDELTKGSLVAEASR